MPNRPRLLLGAITIVLLAALVSCAGPHPGALPADRVAAPATPTDGTGTGSAGGGRRPIVVIGASFSAGVGAGGRRFAWPARLGRIMDRPVLVRADPGAGYLASGAGHRGPFRRLLSGSDTAGADPALVIVQGGRDDLGFPLPKERTAVAGLLGHLDRQFPDTRIAVLTVSVRGDQPGPAARQLDDAIIESARRADPHVQVIDPIAEHWRYPRIADRLHPSRAGHLWIARRVATDLELDAPTLSGRTAAGDLPDSPAADG